VGNSVILKSPQAPPSALRLLEIAVDLPPGVLNLITEVESQVWR
jgi:acyl-CoA reductase-like NAD-dependent aldehyde dehydrogenase